MAKRADVSVKYILILIFNLIVLNYLVIQIFSTHHIHVFDYCMILVLKCTPHQFSIFIVIFVIFSYTFNLIQFVHILRILFYRYSAHYNYLAGTK